MSSDEYNEVALEMAMQNIENVMGAVDNWYLNEKKMSIEAFEAVRTELEMAWSLLNYMHLKQTKGE